MAAEGQELALHRAVLVLWRVQSLAVATLGAVLPLVAAAALANDLPAVVRLASASSPWLSWCWPAGCPDRSTRPGATASARRRCSSGTAS